ncbi:HEAT repeat domain-containing protein [Paenibacillaceae bacterium]|nr:HEAT repeat domain-containing protein [Paenibacillaceae bacterium]
MLDIQTLEKLIYECKNEEAIRIVNNISETKDESYLNVLIKHLKSTEDNLLRNQIALALSDIGENEALDSLIEVITHPRTKGSRGTLLYSLENLDYVSHIDTIANFIGDPSLEVSMQSFLLLEYVADELSNNQKEKCKSIFESKLKINENEFVKDALELLR